MSPTPPSSARSATRGVASLPALVLVLVLALAACGTTEARSNPELQPGSGDLGPGDTPDSAMVDDPDAPVDDDPDRAGTETGDPEELDGGLDGGLDPGPMSPGAPCESIDARREISALPARVFLAGFTTEQRVAAVQLGDDPVVAERITTGRARAATDAKTPKQAAVTRVICVDNGSARVVVTLLDDTGERTTSGTAMLVDGSWRITLHAFCEWNTTAPCTDVPDLAERALAALSPALRQSTSP